MNFLNSLSRTNISVATSLGIQGVFVGEDTLEAIRELDKILSESKFRTVKNIPN